MRSLTVQRKKSFVACTAKMKVYIEDAAAELVIGDVPCRKLGELKNGEKKTFFVGEQAAKVFVIADVLSKNYCGDCYQLPAGTAPVDLIGGNKFNLGNGNAFRFENNDNAVSLRYRKRSEKKGAAVLAVSIVVGLVIGGFAGKTIVSSMLANHAAQPKSYSAGGMSITLTDEFRQSEADGFEVVYDSANVAVLALKEEFSLADGLEAYTVEEYGTLVMQVNGLENAQLQYADGLVWFEYESETENGVFCFYAYLYKAGDAFWMIQFATPKEGAEQQVAQIAEWAASVKFDS